MTKQNVKSDQNPAQHRELPGSWRSVWIILPNVLQQGPQPCSHALPFGYCFLCTHPRVDEMIENTKKTEMAARSVE